MSKIACAGAVIDQKISGVFTAVAQIKDFSLDDVGGESIDVTALDSAADGNSVIWKEMLSNAIADPGSCSMTLFLDPALSGHQSIVSAAFGSTIWKVIYPNSGGAYDQFTSSTHKCSRKVAVGEALTMEVKTQNTGPVTQF